MVRRYGRRHRGGGKSLVKSLEKIGTGVALVGPAAYRLTGGGSAQDKLNGIVHDYTGLWLPDGSWEISRLVRGWGPVVGFSIARVGAHKIIGLIRRL